MQRKAALKKPRGTAGLRLATYVGLCGSPRAHLHSVNGPGSRGPLLRSGSLIMARGWALLACRRPCPSACKIDQYGSLFFVHAIASPAHGLFGILPKFICL
jgi:hypothetical protein